MKMTVNKMIISFEEAMILRHLVEREIKERGEIKELVDLLNKINDMIAISDILFANNAGHAHTEATYKAYHRYLEQ